MLAGLLGAGLAAAYDWRAGLIALAAMPLVSAGLLAVAPERSRGGASGVRFRLAPLIDPVNLIRPLQALRRMPQLVPLAVASLGFAMAQGCTLAFFTTYMTDGLGLSLALAGAIYSVPAVASFAGRVVAGFVADWLGSTRKVLVAMAVASAAALVLLAGFDGGWPRWLMFAAAGVIGLFVATWNGLFLAELAKVAPEGKVGEATASATFFTFVAYMVAPPLFATLVWVTGYSVAYLCVALAVLSARPVLLAGSRPAEHG